MVDTDKAVEKIERGGAWEETDQVVRVEAKRPLDKVIPVRLPADKWEQIREEARELGVGPTTLVRMWILEFLRSKAMWRTSRVPSLILKEAEILEKLSKGHLNHQIAKDLGINEETLRNIKRLADKLFHESHSIDASECYLFDSLLLHRLCEQQGKRSGTDSKETSLER